MGQIHPVFWDRIGVNNFDSNLESQYVSAPEYIRFRKA